MKTRTKIELTLGYIVLALIPLTIIASCNHSNNLYQAKQLNYPFHINKIGSHDKYKIGDSVIVDETLFVDMGDNNGDVYVITKSLGTIPIQ